MTSIWHVDLQHRLEESPDAEVLDALTDALADFDVAVGVDPQHLLSIGVRIEARTLRAAADRAERIISEALAGSGAGGTTVGLTTLAWDEFERRVTQPVVPRLASLQDIAVILDESKQQAQNLVERYADQLPPVGETAAGRVWLWATIERFKSFPRAGRGRPAKPFDQRARELVDVVETWAAGKDLTAERLEHAAGVDLEAAGIRIRVTFHAVEQPGSIEVASDAGAKRYDEVSVPTPRELRAVLDSHRKALSRTS